ncbi:MAG: tyrosine-type recombinase/integrase [Acidimicrobiales bacterium]
MTGRSRKGDGAVYYDRPVRRWRAVVELPADPARPGYRRRKSVTANSRAEALEKLRYLRVQADESGSQQESPLCCGVWMEHWLQDVVPSLRIGSHTAADYRKHARPIISALGSIPLAELTPENIETMFQAMASRGLARNTIRLTKATLSRALGHAERRGVVVRNAAKLAILPAAAKAPKERRTLTRDEVERLMGALKHEPDEAMWLCSLLLGLRPGEVAAISWQDVDLGQGVLHVVQARKWTPEGHVIGSTKTKRAVRTLRMPANIVETFGQMERCKPDELVFTSKCGSILDPSNLGKRLIKLCVKAEIDPPIVPYELRHTAASLLSDAGVPIEELADFMGHSTTAMLEQVYRHRVRKVIDVTKAMGGA